MLNMPSVVNSNTKEKLVMIVAFMRGIWLSVITKPLVRRRIARIPTQATVPMKVAVVADTIAMMNVFITASLIALLPNNSSYRPVPGRKLFMFRKGDSENENTTSKMIGA